MYINKLPPVKSTASASRRFIVNLMASDGKTPEVRSCEITSLETRNRTSFQRNAAINDVFVDDVAKALEGCLKKLTGSTEVLSLPDFVLELPGLVLADVQLMATRVANGTMNLIFRFKLIMGGINRVFKTNLGITDNIQDHAAYLSANIMADIALPLLDICAAAETGMLKTENRLSACLSQLGEKSHEIRFHVELLKRFLMYTDCVPNPEKFASLRAASFDTTTHLR